MTTTAATTSPTLVSLFLLLVGLAGLAIIGARTINLPAMLPRADQSPTMVDDDSLVPDDEQV